MVAASIDEVGARPGLGAWRTEGERVVRTAVGGLVGGLAAGALVAGVGGRIAMRVVALQSPDAYQGLTTDDGAATGEITLLGSLGLIVFLALVGALGGLVYAVVRDALPARRRPLAWGVVSGLVVGAMIIHADGVDYAVLGERWVSAAMFGAVAAGYGVVAAALAERALRPGGLARRVRPGWLAVAFVPFLAGLTIVPVALALAAVTAARATGLVARVPRRPVAIATRLLLVGVAGLSAVDLARTLSDLA